MKTALLLIVLVSIGCAQTPNPQFSINGFESYYDTFVGNTNKPTNNLIIKFGDLSSTDTPSTDEIGLCVWSYTPTVTIDLNYWTTASEDDRQELIDHELGHCILLRQHRNDSLSNGNPASIMNAYHFSGFYMQQNATYYYNELVNGD